MTKSAGIPRAWRTAGLLLLTALFFVLQYDPYVQITEETISEGLLDVLGTIETGSFRRQAALLCLGILALPFIFRRGGRSLRIDGWQGWSLPLFIFWCFLSVLWSDHPGLSARRLLAFAMICIGALGFARAFTGKDLVLFAWAATAAYLSAGVLAEAAAGTFHPFQREYRFAGLMHPNNQAINCAILLMSSLASAYSREWGRRRKLLLAVSAAALFFLFLTKSRTTMAGVAFALAAYGLFSNTGYRRIAYVLGGLWVLCFVLLFLPDGAVVSIASGTIFPGREASDFRTLTGRTEIWKASLPFIADRPVFGYGYGSFWDEHRIRRMEDIAGWLASHGHSTYIDLLLSLGIAGLFLYLVMMAGGIGRSFARWENDGSRASGFLFSLLLYCMFLGLLETVFPNPGFLNFLVLSGLALLISSPAADEGETW